MSTTNKYFYNGVDIFNLVSGSGTSVPGYTGFPQSTPFVYTSTIDKPANFSYTYLSSPYTTDVSNYATAYIPLLSGGTIPTTIPGASGYSFKHISAFCWGGNGGGGGGGYPQDSGIPGNGGSGIIIIKFTV